MKIRCSLPCVVLAILLVNSHTLANNLQQPITRTSGVSSDIYENDDTIGLPSTITTAINQSRTLTFLDTDYIEFVPTAGVETYSITVSHNTTSLDAYVYFPNSNYVSQVEFRANFPVQNIVFNQTVVLCFYYTDVEIQYFIQIDAVTLTDPNEPDNSIASTSTIGANSTSTTQALPIGDQDYFVYTSGQQQEFVNFYVTGLQASLIESVELVLYWGINQPIKTVYGNSTGIIVPATTSVYVKIKWSDVGYDVDQYQLNTRVLISPTDKFEPDSNTNPIPIIPGNNYFRQVDQTDADYFSIDFDVNSPIEITIGIFNYKQGLDLQIYDANLNSLSYETISHSLIYTFNVSTSGQYILEFTSGEFVYFTLNVNKTVVPDIAEYNDIENKAYQLYEGSYNFSLYPVTKAFPYDTDFYFIKLNQSEVEVNIAFDVPTIIDFGIKQGDNTYYTYQKDKILVNSSYTFIFESLPDQYLFYLKSGDTQPYNAYEYIGYNLTIKFRDGDGTYDRLTASPIAVNSTVTGNLSLLDRDYFVFQLDQPTKVVVVPTTIANSLANIGLDLINENNTESYIYWNPDGNITAILPADTYYLSVYPIDNYPLAYEISITGYSNQTTSVDNTTRSLATSSGSSTNEFNLPGFQFSSSIFAIFILLPIIVRRRKTKDQIKI